MRRGGDTGGGGAGGGGYGNCVAEEMKFTGATPVENESTCAWNAPTIASAVKVGLVCEYGILLIVNGLSSVETVTDGKNPDSVLASVGLENETNSAPGTYWIPGSAVGKLTVNVSVTLNC